MIGVKFSTFIDRAGVNRKLSKYKRRVLGGTGAFGRSVIRYSIRSGGKGGKISRPNRPPRSHVGLLKRHIYFGVDPTTETVVIGPLVFKSQPKFAGGVASIPEVLEFGGTELVQVASGQTRADSYEPRPYVGPALDVVREKMGQLVESVPLA